MMLFRVQCSHQVKCYANIAFAGFQLFYRLHGKQVICCVHVSPGFQYQLGNV